MLLAHVGLDVALGGGIAGVTTQTMSPETGGESPKGRYE